MINYDKEHIELHTHVGHDMDDMCCFLNQRRIGYCVTECHHMVGDTQFKDYPHYTACFVFQGFAPIGFERIKEAIKAAKHITFHMSHRKPNDDTRFIQRNFSKHSSRKNNQS